MADKPKTYTLPVTDHSMTLKFKVRDKVKLTGWIEKSANNSEAINQERYNYNGLTRRAG